MQTSGRLLTWVATSVQFAPRARIAAARIIRFHIRRVMASPFEYRGFPLSRKAGERGSMAAPAAEFWRIQLRCKRIPQRGNFAAVPVLVVLVRQPKTIGVFFRAAA